MQEILRQFSQRAGLVRWLANELPVSTACTLYLSFVRPVCEYASPLWHGSLREEDANAMERVQAGVARRLLKAPWDTPKPHLLKALNWSSLRWRREVASMVLFQSVIHTRPNPLSTLLFPFSKDVHPARNLRKLYQLVIGKATTTRLQSSFFYRSSVQWNTLPKFLQEPSTSQRFKQLLETHWSRYQFNTSKNVPDLLSVLAWSLSSTVIVFLSPVSLSLLSLYFVLLPFLSGDPLD